MRRIVKETINLARLTMGATLLSVVIVATTPKFVPASQSPSLIEIAFTWCQADCQTITTRIYDDGRYVREGKLVEQAKSGRQRKISMRVEKQLESEEVAELVRWAGQSDFVNAQPEYIVKIVQDSPSWLTIAYSNKGKEKKIRVANFIGEEEAAKRMVPPSVLHFIKWELGK